MSTKATAARIYEYGEPDVFCFETMDVPDPVGHEVLVRNTVIGLNFVDIPESLRLRRDVMGRRLV